MTVLMRTGHDTQFRHRRAATDVASVQPLVAVTDCHGSTGVTSVAALLQPAIGIGVVAGWPRYAANREFAGRPLVLVPRGTVQATAGAGDG